LDDIAVKGRIAVAVIILVRRRNSSAKDLRGAGTESWPDGTGSLKCNLGSTA